MCVCVCSCEVLKHCYFNNFIGMRFLCYKIVLVSILIQRYPIIGKQLR